MKKFYISGLIVLSAFINIKAYSEEPPSHLEPSFYIKLAISPDNKTVAFSSEEKIYLLDVKTKKITNSFSTHSMNNIFFTNDSKNLIAYDYSFGTSNINHLKIWDMKTKVTRDIQINSIGGYKITFNKDNTLFTISNVKDISIYSFKTGKLIKKLELKNSDSPVNIFTNDNKGLVLERKISEKNIYITNLLDLSTGKTINSFKGNSLDISHDGNTVATWEGSNSAINLFDSKSGKIKSIIKDIIIYPKLIFTSDDKNALSASSYDINVFDTESGKLTKKLPVSDSPINEVVTNGNLIASSTYDGHIYLWDLKTGKNIQKTFISDLFIKPKGTQLVNQKTKEYQENPNILYDNKGSFIISWYSHEGPSGFHARRFNKLSKPISHEFNINLIGNDDDKMFMDKKGKLSALGFSYSQKEKSKLGIQSYNNLGKETDFKKLASISPDEISANLDDKGNSVIAWSECIEHKCQIFVQKFNQSGKNIGNKIKVSLSTINSNKYPVVCLSKDGSFAVIWEAKENSHYSSTGSLYFKLFDNKGKSLGQETTLTLLNTYASIPSKIKMTPEGDYIVIWKDTAIIAEKIDKKGKMIEKPFFIAKNGENFSLDFIPDGRFIAVWEDKQKVYGRWFEKSGKPHGNEFMVIDNGINPAVASDDKGNAVITWQANDGNGTGIYAKSYSLK